MKRYGVWNVHIPTGEAVQLIETDQDFAAKVWYDKAVATLKEQGKDDYRSEIRDYTSWIIKHKKA